MNTLNDFHAKYKTLQDKICALKNELHDFVFETIDKAANENPYGIKKISNNCYIIKLSMVMGRPMHPLYYDFNASAKQLKEYLECKDVLKWVDEIETAFNKSENESVIFHSGERKIVLSKAFARKIVEMLKQ